MNLDEYLTTSPRGEARVLAKQIGVKAPLISLWRLGRRPVPAERCPDIELATSGLIRCEDLRPDINWAVLRNQSPQAA